MIALSDHEQLSRKLRISVTDHCNFGCFFCHNEGQGPLGRNRVVMSVAEIATLANAAMDAGVQEIKLTGGEPLTYRFEGHSFVDVVRAVSEARAGRAVGLSVTTNGMLLARSASVLRGAGLDRATVSIHTLRASTLRTAVSKRGSEATVRLVVDGLRAAAEVGLTPLKVNTVLFAADGAQAGNFDEVPALLGLCREAGVTELRLYTLLAHARFDPAEFQRRYRFWDEASVVKLAGHLADDAAGATQLAVATQRFIREWRAALYPKPTLHLPSGDLTVCIEAMEDGRLDDQSLPAEGAYALRLSATGELRGFLGAPTATPLLKMLRRGAKHADLVAAFENARETLLPNAAAPQRREPPLSPRSTR